MTLNDLRDLENEVKVTMFYIYIGLRLSMVPMCTKFSENLSNRSSDINHKPYQMILNDLNNLENKVMVTKFEPGLCFAMGPLYTKFGEKSSNTSSDTEQKSF